MLFWYDTMFTFVIAVGMSSYITGEDHDDELNVVQQLEEMYQVCLHEACKLFSIPAG